MQIRVLGSAAGGGFPQWNCGCSNCRGLRDGTIAASPRREECVAISADGQRWFLLNAPPEIRTLLATFPPLWPSGKRHTPIAGIVLTNGDLDHLLGLFVLRESQPITVYATPAVRRGIIEHNAIYRTLERFSDQVRWIDLPSSEIQLDDRLFLTAVPSPGKRPIHLERIGAPSFEDNVGLIVREGERRLAYFPAVAHLAPEVADAIASADAVFFDGTFYTSDELIAAGLGTKRAEEMAHLPVVESLPHLGRLRAKRRILIHLNNTNPLLVEDSAERRAVAGIVEIAHDGMELEL